MNTAEDEDATGLILVVDDDEQIRRALEKSLRRLGHQVILADNGTTGLQVALEKRPQIIIADIRMPEMDGHTLLRRLNAAGLGIPVIMTSGHGTLDDAIDALRNGVVDYLKKPWTPNELMFAISRAFEAIAKQNQNQFHGGTQSRDVSSDAPSKKLQSIPEKGPLDQSHDIFASALEQIRKGEIVLPSTSAVLAEIRLLVRKPNSKIEDIVALIERDPRLATQVLRISNSAAYGIWGKHNDIGAAVNRIGLRQVQNLAETVIARSAYSLQDPALRNLQSRVWKYSVASAVSMRALAEVIGLRHDLEPETAYVAGLLSDVGASFLLWLLDRQKALGSRIHVESEACIAAIREQHQEVGAGLLKSWGLDPAVTLIAQSHHAKSPPTPGNSYWSLYVTATTLADALTGGENITRGEPVNPTLVDMCGADLRIGTSMSRKILDSVRKEFNSITESLG